MKRIFTLSVAAILFAGSAFAQDVKKEAKKDKAAKEFKKQGRHGKHDKGRLAKELNLTEAQKQQMKAIREEQKAKMQNVLTAEQKAKRAELKEKRKNEFKNKERNNEARDRMEGMKKELGLSEAQGQKIKALNEEFKAKAQAIKNNASLTDQQRKEQFNSLNEERKTRMKAILTAEQLQKLESRKGKGQFNNKRPSK
jgi:Spy/CpxP family protein refolding chaperone